MVEFAPIFTISFDWCRLWAKSILPKTIWAKPNPAIPHPNTGFIDLSLIPTPVTTVPNAAGIVPSLTCVLITNPSLIRAYYLLLVKLLLIIHLIFI